MTGAATPPENSFHPLDRAEWRRWLELHHESSAGVWLIAYKKATGKPRVHYDEAVEEALCFGWVDSKVRRLDEARTMLWFAPRRRGSGWSASNRQRVERLIEQARMTPAGLAKLEAAKRDGSRSARDGVEPTSGPPLRKAAMARSARQRQEEKRTGKKDPRVDAYIRAAAPFARPVLRHLRSVVHEAAPDIDETLKWRVPHFVQDGIVCGMAAFKAHCAFWFWRGQEVAGVELPSNREGMGRQFGRITSIEDLPSRTRMLGLVRKAVRLNAGGPPAPAAPPRARAVAVPEALSEALARNETARMAFAAMSASQRREYAEWIAGAKRDETRERRTRTAIEWIAAGKPRNWKYMKHRRQPVGETAARTGSR